MVELTANSAKVSPVARPEEEPIFVALDRLQRCADEIPDSFWAKEGGTAMIDPPTTDEPPDAVTSAPMHLSVLCLRSHPLIKPHPCTPRELPKNNPWHGRLPGRKRHLLVRRGICNTPGSEHAGTEQLINNNIIINML